MKNKFAFASPVIRSLAALLFLTGSYHSLKAASLTHPAENNCPEGSIILKQQPDAPLQLSIQKAICNDYSSNIDLRLENTGTKTIILYEISDIQDYENRKGLENLQGSGSLIKPGESAKANVNGGIAPSRQKSYGLFKTHLIKLSWVKFSDGTLWGQDYGRSNPKPFPGYDLILSDDKQPLRASFEFKGNTFAIGSDQEYGFGGPGFKVETAGCKKHLTFDFRWREYDFSYHPRENPASNITIKANDNLHGDFNYDSCTKAASGTIRDENQNFTLMNLSGTNISHKEL